LGRSFPGELTRRLVRYEPLALLIPADHPLAALVEVPLERLRGVQIDASVGNPNAPEWVDLGVSLLEAFGARPSPAHAHVVGTSETARHLQSHGFPILTMTECPPVPGGVIRPLVEPVPVYPWAMVHRGDAKYPELATLTSVVTELAGKEGWDKAPDGAWLASADARWSGRS
jgi:DNA-binding transcriptional LysR family regulator